MPRGIAAAVAAWIAVGLMAPAVAQGTPRVGLTAVSGPPGQAVTAVGRDFADGSCSVARDGSVQAFGDTCNASYTVSMPTTPGTYTITLATGTQSASATYRVEEPEPEPSPEPPPPSPTPTPPPPPPSPTAPPPPPPPPPPPSPSPSPPSPTPAPTPTATEPSPTESTPSPTPTPTPSPTPPTPAEPAPPTAPGGTLEVDGVLRDGQPWPIASPCLFSAPGATVVDVDGRSVDTTLTDLGDGITADVAEGALRVRRAVAGSVTPPLAMQHVGTGGVRLDLGDPRGWLGVHVGRNDDGGPATVTVTGLDDDGTPVARVSADLPAGPAPVFTCLELSTMAPTSAEEPPTEEPSSDAEAALPTGERFATVEIDVTAGTADIQELIDHLVVADAPPTRDGAVEVDLDGPGGTIDLHADAQTTVSGTVTADRELAAVEVWQSYRSPRDIGRERVRRLGPAQWAAQPDGTVRVWAHGRLVAGEGSIGIHVRTVTGRSGTARHPVTVQRPTGRPATVGEGAEVPGDGDTDLAVAGVEVTQGMRASALTVSEAETGVRLTDDQPLVAGRTTLLRVLPTADTDVAGVTARVVGVRDGVPLAGGPLEPLWSAATVTTVDDLDRLRSGVDGVLTFRLPAAWTRDPGELTLAVELDPPGVDTRQTCQDCRAGDLLHVDLAFESGGDALGLWPRARGGVSREVVARTVASLTRWMPLADDGIDLVRPLTAPAGDDDVAAWVLQDLLTDLAAGRDVVQLWLGPPGSCGARALVGAGIAAAGACSHVPAHALAHTLGLDHAEDAHRGWSGCGEVVGTAVDVTSRPPRVTDPQAPWGDEEAALLDDLDDCEQPHAHDLMSAGGRTVVTSPSTWEAVTEALADGDDRSLLTPLDGDGDTEVVVVSDAHASRAVVAGAHGLARADAEAEVDGEVVEARHIRDEAGAGAWVVALPAGGWDRLEVGPHTIARGDDLDVTIESPASGVATGGAVEVAWSGATEDARAVVEVAGSDGAWWPVAVTDEDSIALEELPVGGPVRIRVQVSDGARHGMSEAVDVAVPPRSPDLLVASPVDGQHVAAGRGVELVGLVAGDVDDDDLVWEVDGTEVARGRRALATGLELGRHEVVLRAVDRSAAGARARVSLAVQTDTDGDGIDDPWEVTHGLDPLDPRDAQQDQDADGVTAVEEFAAGAVPTAADSDGDGSWDGIELAAGTDPSSASSVPSALHTWPDPLPVPTAAGTDAEPPWWDEWLTPGRLLLVTGVVLVVILDVWLVVRRRLRRRYG